MTKEQKQLLLVDLCARLPYMPKIKISYQQQGIKGTEEGNVSCDFIEKIVNDLRNGVIIDMQIYLRSMSSMAQEEREYIESLSDFKCTLGYATDKIDFCLKHHFDFRGLIPLGLALEAPTDMYNLNK